VSRFIEDNNMKSISGLSAACFVAVLLIAGCDQIPGAGPGSLIVDLTAIAKATGQEESMQDRAQTAREDVNAQLIESARELEQRLVDERTKIGDKPTQEQEVQLQQLTQQAQQQYAQLQSDAQQKVQQAEINLVLDYRETVKPFAEKIARSRGASVVLLAGQSVFWLDPAVDITGDVISALRAEGVFAGSDADQVPATPAATPIEAPSPAAAE
jgi:Skp family chaperone for outer membrane proteins